MTVILFDEILYKYLICKKVSITFYVLVQVATVMKLILLQSQLFKFQAQINAKFPGSPFKECCESTVTPV